MTQYRLPNKEVVVILKEVLAAMDVKNYNVFRVRAYQNAISILDNLTVSIYDLWENHRLEEIPGVGNALIQHLSELFTTGGVKEFETVKEGLPEGMFSLIGLRGIGARKAFKLSIAFKLVNRATAIEKLKEHALKGDIQKIEGFGEKSEKDILEAIEQAKMTKNQKPRTLLFMAEQVVDRIKAHMSTLEGVDHLEAAGSFRRRNPTIGDLDFPISVTNGQDVLNHFLKFPEIAEVLVEGDKKVSVVLKNDMQVDMRVTSSQSYGAMLQYFTGSKQHNILLRNYALDRGLSISEYGIKKGDKLFEFENEEDFYKFLGLQYIPPEIRNGSNEIEMAAKGKIPTLITLDDIKGDVHSHTVDSDGTATLEEMVAAAKSLGYEYLGISDHAPSVTARGYDEAAKVVMEKRRVIDKINSEVGGIKVLFGYEVNILADATLGLPDELLKILDYVVASIHTSFDQDRDTVTKRLLCAIENPYVNIIGHPSGRLLNKRDPIDPDWRKIFDAVRENNKILEINAQPDRLDLTDDLVKEALSWGVNFVVATDAHSPDQLLNMKYGIDTARRGWLQKLNVLNTLSFDDFCKKLNVRNV